MSSDSRQFYRELQIGACIPSKEELSLAEHHFIAHLSIKDNYNVSKYETDALQKIDLLFLTYNKIIVVGGSGLYTHAVCHGIDELPDPDPEIRLKVKQTYQEFGITALQTWLQELDPLHFDLIDKANPNRLMRAIEICLQTGTKLSSIRHNRSKQRNFVIIKIALDLPRDELHLRINKRVDMMISNGLVEEARQLYQFRSFNSLNTVGYKELFDFFDGVISEHQAIEKIKTNTRRYARRQLTWLRKDKEFRFFHPNQIDNLIKYIEDFNA